METETPVSYYRFQSRPINRQLWPQKKIEEKFHNNWISRNDITCDPWDEIESPQFIDFVNVSENSDRFFETKAEEKSLQHSAEAQSLPGTSDHNELIELLNNVSLAKENKQRLNANIGADKDKKKKQNSTIQCVRVKHETTSEDKKCVTELHRNPTVVKPFTSDLHDKWKKQQKEEQIKKTHKEDKDDKEFKVFRAQPLPQFIKASLPSKFGCTSGVKFEQSNNKSSEKSVKKCAEMWKKTPFVVRPAQKIATRAKTPPLLTAIRAEKRKRFEERLREKEKEMEMRNCLAAMAAKKVQKEEIIRLRKETVHKAQPIPKYKSSLPQIAKRPLTEPLSPFNHKRRRRT